MAKNITVIDVQGNVYEATYPKRAKGLVKKGRARFVNETAICLARPPFQTEDDRMSEAEKVTAKALPAQIDAAYIIQKIDQIMADSSYLHAALRQLENLDEEGAIAAGTMVEAREQTNRSIIRLLEQMLDKVM